MRLGLKRQIPKQRINSGLDEGWWKLLTGQWTVEDAEAADHPEAFEMWLGTYDKNLYTHQNLCDLAVQYRAEVETWAAVATPGKRPRAWWRYCAPEARRRVSGRMVRRFVEPVKHQPGDPDWNTWRNSMPFEGHWEEVPDPDDPPMIESESAFLRRHGLLSAAEARRLTAKDFEPESEDGVEHHHRLDVDSCNCAEVAGRVR